MVVPGFNAMLIHSCYDVANLAARLYMPEIAAKARDMADNGVAALETPWRDDLRLYLCFGRTKVELSTAS